jgi:predicted TIM-barrel fold metal-dependent hydrolase
LEGAKFLDPVFEVAQKHQSHVYLHTGGGSPSIPGQPEWRHGDSPGPRGSLDNLWNFAAATITLAYTGFLDAYPDVTVQVAQLGGSGGIALVEELAREAGGRSGPPTPGKFRQIYLDTGAGGRGPEAIALAVRVFGPERVVLGTDYAPQASVVPVIANVNRSPLSAAQRRAVLVETPRQLLESKGVRIG